MEKLNVTCRIPKDAVESLDKLGELIDRDRSYLINEAIAHYVAIQKWQIDEVERAIKEVEAGDALSEEEFIADMKTWRRQN